MATDKNFIVKNGLEVGGQEVISSSGVVSSAALGGQTLGTTDSPTFANTTLTGSLRGPATFTIDPAAVGDNTGTLVIAGNLQVDGTTTTINSTTMEVDDLNITLASGAANAAAANGAGITVDGASATITYDSTNDEWDFNKDINVTGTVTADGLKIDTTNYYINLNSYIDALPADNGESHIFTTSGTGSGFFAKFGALGISSRNESTASSDIGFFTDKLLRAEIANGGDISFYEDTGTTAKFFWDASTERLGIGTTSPDDSLHVKGAGATFIRLEQGNGSNYGLIKQNQSLQALQFGVGGDFAMTINNSEKVGIGTTDIDAVLHVKDDAAANDNFDVLIEGFRPNLVFEDISTSATDFQLFVDSNRLDFLYGDASTDTKLANTAMSIDSSGNVGIGDSSPSAKLEVTGSSNSTYLIAGGDDSSNGRALTFTSSASANFNGAEHTINAPSSQGVIALSTYSTERMRIDSSGNVGIGTDNPQYKFDVYGTSDVTMRIHRPSSGLAATDTCGIGFSQRGDTATSSSDTRAGIFSTYNGDLFLAVESGGNLNSNPMDHSALFIEGSDGSVGIGTTSPSAKLHLHNTVEEVLRIDSGDTGAIHFFEDSTRRGIIGYSNGTSIASNAGAGDMVLRAESGKNIHLGISGTSYVTVNSSGLTAAGLQLTDSSEMGFGTTAAGSSVGHTASTNEGIFWHSTNTDYGIFRTAGAWSGDYSQLRLEWTTGIIIDGGTAYGKSGTRIIGDLICGTGTGYPHSAAINSAYFHSTGDTTQPACRLVQVSNSNSYPVVRMRHESTTAGRYIEFRTDENVLTGIIQDVSGTMQYQSSSDSRLKENVEPMAEGLTEVLAMNPVKFTWKDIVTENKTVDMESAESRGFLAQELNEEYPWAVYEGGEDEKNDPWSVDYGKLTPILVKAIQELKEELDAAKARITELEG